MKKTSLLIILILALVTLTGCNRKDKAPDDLYGSIMFKNKITVGVKTDAKPFGFVEKGELQGLDVDIAKQIAIKFFGEENEGNIEFVPVTTQNRISMLNSKKVDMVIATMSISPKRSAIVDFTVPYYMAGQAIMVKQNSKILSIEGLNKKTVCIILGSTGEKTVRAMAPSATIVGAEGYPEAFFMLQNNQVDAILADDSILYGLFMDNHNFKILPKRYTREFYAIALRKDKDSVKLKEELDRILSTLQQTGEINRIKEKWIPIKNPNLNKINNKQEIKDRTRKYYV